jgi:hypothetical protein
MDLLPIEQAEVIQSAEGTTWIWTPAPSLMVSRVHDKLTLQAGRALESKMRRIIIDNPPYEGFHDWEKMTNYDTDTRIQLTEASRAGGGAIRGHHILLASKIVSFGVQIASTVLTNIHMYTSRESFESALRSSIERARR